MLYIGMYLLAVVLANLVIAEVGPSAAIVVAFVFIGLDLTSRDKLHEAWRGRGLLWKMALLIGSGSLLSYLLNKNAGPVALASLIAFAASAAIDTLVYQVLHNKHWMVKVNGSNLFSAAVDSLVFPTVAFGSFLPWIVLGQFSAKLVGGFIWSVILTTHNVHKEAAYGDSKAVD